MEHLPQTRKHHGDFLFIEEDHYVSPDLIHHWKLMKLAQKDLKESDTAIDILTMGNYEFNVQQKSIDNMQTEMTKLNLTNWFSSKHNMAFTIDRSLWSRIKSCQFAFCTFDDYNWDWSLQHTIDECLKRKLRTLVTVVPRVFHTGTCGGLHHKQKHCDENSETNKLKKFLAQNQEYQFIDQVRIEKHFGQYRKGIKNNGGWNDRRDHQLCQQYQLPFLQIFHQNEHFYPLLKNDFLSEN
ncbi:alpha-1,6-mannosyl-glycoprotein [Euroglyphus maynei]|uniref:Alpha-1,6-mannosyl-glycoprotein 2-beta-N-acetylglucosaminyltransferase n=1 Tax=Euroglyphus maynei TaxID=6958 RepID=A0A1Y3BC50_EURMA|nr:alpha-1,6-mannosyl-glycoprotein [Euroglyphus maynei]